jgi:hypothetical protein
LTAAAAAAAAPPSRFTRRRAAPPRAGEPALELAAAVATSSAERGLGRAASRCCGAV